MRFYLYRASSFERNFGDELNTYLWPRLIHPDASHLLPDAMFYGIGTVLGSRQPVASHHIIFGAGTGYQGLPPKQGIQKIYFVRGPLSGEQLGACYITDPANLMALFVKRADPIYRVSFMPRYDGITDDLREGCHKLGIHLIDPRWPLQKVLADLAATEMLLSEALHGAVVADALRIPWLSIYGERGHEFKWHDWTRSLGMHWQPVDAAQRTLKWAMEHGKPTLSSDADHKLLQERVLDKLAEMNRDIAERLDVFKEETK